MIKLISAIALFMIFAAGCGSGSSEKEKQPDIKISPTGLKYLVLEKGDGKKPEFGSVVTVHQIVKDEEGNVLENTYENESPFIFKIGADETIAGLEEGVLEMKAGGKMRLFVPPDLAFGRRQVRNIPRNSTLVIDVELMNVE